MKFFSIKPSSDTLIIGPEYPQIQTMQGTVNKNAPDSLYNVGGDVFPNFIPNLDYFVLQPKAKITDVLSAAMISHGFILNDKVKKILSNYHLPPHQFYPAVIKYNETLLKDYFWFYYISDILDFIDFDRTKFFISDMVDNKIEECNSINSAQKLRSIKDALPHDRNVDSDVINLKRGVTDNFDLFQLSFGDYRTYVSEGLASALTNISGFSLSASKKVFLAE